MTYYHGDHLGSSVVITNGANVQRVLYRPFGQAAPDSDLPVPEFGFTGQRYVDSIGIYDYGARWYEPALGRFLSPDSVVPAAYDPQSVNPYSYVRNNPLNRIDPTGNFDLGAAWGGFTGFCSNYLSPLSNFASGFGSALGYSLGFGGEPSGSGFFFDQGAGLGSLVGMSAGVGLSALSLPFEAAGSALSWVPGVGGALATPFSWISSPVGGYAQRVVQRAEVFSDPNAGFRSLGGVLADGLGAATYGGVFAMARGILGGANAALAGISHLNPRAVGGGSWDAVQALVWRYGGTGGPAYGVKQSGIIFNNAAAIRSGEHDVGYSGHPTNSEMAQADRALVLK